MRYIRQLLLILAFSFAGEMLKILLPFPVPASIYGLILLFVALEGRIIRPGMVKDTAKYLIEIMPLMFIPAGVGLLDSWEALRPVFMPAVVIVTVSTFAVMAVSGRVTQSVIRKKERKEKETA